MLDEVADQNMNVHAEAASIENGAASWRRKSLPQPLVQSPNFGDDLNGGEPRERLAAPSIDCDAIGRHLRAFREADRMTLNYAQLEADRIEAKLQSSRQLGAQLKPQVERMCDETRRLTNMLQQLETQLSASKDRLLGLQQGKRGAGGAGSRDYERKHVTDTLKFMQQTFEEEEGMLQETNHANRQLEKSCESLEHNLNALRREQVRISEEARSERECRKKEERQVSDLKEERRMLYEGAALVASQQKEEEGGRQRDAQPAHNSVEFTTNPQQSSRHSEPYLWASSLVGGAIGTGPIATAASADDGLESFTGMNALRK